MISREAVADAYLKIKEHGGVFLSDVVGLNLHRFALN